MTINLRKIEFFNREQEKEEIINILKTEPRVVNFIYGPINSGKSTLIENLIENLPRDYIVFYINLRERMISSYNDFIEILFEYEFEEEKKIKKAKELIPGVIEGVKMLSGIPISTKVFEKIFAEEKPKNAFRCIMKVIWEIKRKNKIPVLIIDEMQKIGDVKVNGLLIYEVFNFFIRLTKEKHLCHVFAISSDSLFIETVYADAKLSGRCRYLLVDDFDKETAKKFLGKYGFSVKEQNIAYNYFGGKPLDLSNLVSLSGGSNIKKIADDGISERMYHLRDMLDKLLYVKINISSDGENIPVKREKLIEVMRMFEDTGEIKDINISRAEKRYLINENILFIDPIGNIIKPQSKLDLVAIRGVLDEVEKSGVK